MVVQIETSTARLEKASGAADVEEARPLKQCRVWDVFRARGLMLRGFGDLCRSGSRVWGLGAFVGFRSLGSRVLFK